MCVYFNNKLMRGNRTIKLDNSALEAFDSPNMPPLAQMAINIKGSFLYKLSVLYTGLFVSMVNVHFLNLVV